MQARYQAHAALLGANLFYGAGFTVAKFIMPRLIAPQGFILIRVLVVALLFSSTYLLGKKFRVPIEQKDYLRLIAAALFGVAINQLLFFKGLNLTTPIHASLMMLCTPVLVSILASIILKDTFTLHKIIGLLLGITGAALLIVKSHNEVQGSNIVLGNLFVFLNAASYAIYLVIVKPLMQKYRPIIVIKWVFCIGLIMVLPFGFSQLCNVPWQWFTLSDYAALAFIVICCTFFTYLWNIFALRILSSSTAGAYIYLQPFFAAIIAVFFFHETLISWKLFSGVLIFTGVYLVSKKNTNS